MYGMDCETKCDKGCLTCNVLDTSHSKIIQLLRKAREIKRIKKIFIRSGVRYDLAMNSKEYIKEISEHHISGCLKIAPEHFSPSVLKLMNKDTDKLKEFVELFESINFKNKQSLRHYLMICHPGELREEIIELREKIKNIKNIDQFQIFTPTPMTISTCMYYTGLNPYTLEKIIVVYDFKTKKDHRDIIRRAL